MYQYNSFDKHFVKQRALQFRDQLERNLAGKLGDDEFRPLRLQNGWYIQRHAPMARIAVPYGELSSTQLRMLGRIAREFDRVFTPDAPATPGRFTVTLFEGQDSTDRDALGTTSALPTGTYLGVNPSLSLYDGSSGHPQHHGFIHGDRVQKA